MIRGVIEVIRSVFLPIIGLEELRHVAFGVPLKMKRAQPVEFLRLLCFHIERSVPQVDFFPPVYHLEAVVKVNIQIEVGLSDIAVRVLIVGFPIEEAAG
jgi:hypothetical protein